MEDVAQRNRWVTLVHSEQRREVTLPTGVRALSPNRPQTAELQLVGATLGRAEADLRRPQAVVEVGVLPRGRC